MADIEATQADLKPCPFCGAFLSPGQNMYAGLHLHPAVQNCPLAGKSFSPHEVRPAAWNTRASTAALEAENARLTAMVSACAGDLDIANEEILAQLDARKRTETENAACSVRLDEANAAAQDFKEQAASLKAENERLTNAVHSCHAECSRPLCVAQRENAGLTARVAELENCIRAADKLCDATIRLVDGFELRAALRKDQP